MDVRVKRIFLIGYFIFTLKKLINLPNQYAWHHSLVKTRTTNARARGLTCTEVFSILYVE
jgi:hypothetical protein